LTIDPNDNIEQNIDNMSTTEGLIPISLSTVQPKCDSKSNMQDDKPTAYAMAIVSGSSNGNGNKGNNKNNENPNNTMMKYHTAWQAIKIIPENCRYFEPTFQQLWLVVRKGYTAQAAIAAAGDHDTPW